MAVPTGRPRGGGAVDEAADGLVQLVDGVMQLRPQPLLLEVPIQRSAQPPVSGSPQEHRVVANPKPVDRTEEVSSPGGRLGCATCPVVRLFVTVILVQRGPGSGDIEKSPRLDVRVRMGQEPSSPTARGSASRKWPPSMMANTLLGARAHVRST
jgi:hypothetical protein